ncbi:MAG: hypothetical protein MEQ84_00305 [Mesorhizobium sp.]|nr:hypothetical protein [Mesorhizobium sp.]
MNSSSRNLAGLVGPVLVALSVTEAMNMGVYVEQTGPVVYLNGTLLFIGGLALVRAHNRWVLDWSVLLTIVAWAALCLGLYRMFAPAAPQAGDHVATYLMLFALFVVGAVLCWAGYIRRD